MQNESYLTQLPLLFRNSFQKYIWFLLVSKVVIVLIGALGTFTHPHIWRQTDTLGVSLAYFIRWTQEPFSFLLALPAVIQSGDNTGILPMELPLLNLLGAPFFSLGLGWGRIGAQWSSIGINIILSYFAWKIWKPVIWNEIPVRLVVLFLPLIPMTGYYFGRVMPDYLAFILTFSGVGMYLRGGYKVGFLLFSTGLLIKPPSVIVGILIFLFIKRKKDLIPLFLWTFCSVFIALLYYMPGIAFLKSMADTQLLYKTSLPNPFSAVVGFFFHPLDIFSLLGEDGLPLFILPLIGVITLYKSIKKRVNLFSSLWFVLFAQLMTIAIIDGPHGFVHSYYFIGTGPTLILIMLEWKKNDSSSWASVIILLGLAIFTFERGWYRVRPLTGQTIYEECSILKAETPEVPWRLGLRVRTTEEPYPETAICFGVRSQSLKSEWGIFHMNRPLPKNCRSLASGKKFNVARCDTENPETPPAKPVL